MPEIPLLQTKHLDHTTFTGIYAVVELLTGWSTCAFVGTCTSVVLQPFPIKIDSSFDKLLWNMAIVNIGSAFCILWHFRSQK